MADHYCAEGWICETHPDRPWPHDDCAGPGMPCLDPHCHFGRQNIADTAHQLRRDANRIEAGSQAYGKGLLAHERRRLPGQFRAQADALEKSLDM
jgi:hypothetical protein